MTSCGRGHPSTTGSGASAKRQAQVCGAPPAWRPTQELAGDRPKERRRQPKNWTGKPLLAGTFMFILDFSGYVSEVARGRGTYDGGSVGVGLSRSYRPLPCPRPLTPFTRGSSEGGPSATSLCSLTQGREIFMLPRTLYFIPAVDPSSRAVRRTTTRCLWSQS